MPTNPQGAATLVQALIQQIRDMGLGMVTDAQIAQAIDGYGNAELLARYPEFDGDPAVIVELRRWANRHRASGLRL